MRMMMQIQVDTDAGNCAIKDGSMGQIVEEALRRLNPEVAYFYAQDGKRAGFVVFDLQETSDIPVITEPLFQELGATITFTPVMAVDDLRKGLQAVREREAVRA